MKKIFIICALVVAAVLLSGSLNKKEYTTETVKHTVSQGETLWVVAKYYQEKQDRYTDIREFIYHIQEDSRLDKKVPLQVGDELTIKLHKEKGGRQ